MFNQDSNDIPVSDTGVIMSIQDEHIADSERTTSNTDTISAILDEPDSDARPDVHETTPTYESEVATLPTTDKQEAVLAEDTVAPAEAHESSDAATTDAETPEPTEKLAPLDHAEPETPSETEAVQAVEHVETESEQRGEPEKHTEPTLPVAALPLVENESNKSESSAPKQHVGAKVSQFVFKGKLTAVLRTKRHKGLALALLVLLLLGILTPLVVGAVYGIQGYSTYNTLKSDAYSGVQHLLNIKNMLSSSSANGAKTTTSTSITSKLLDANTMAQVRSQLSEANSDFTHVNLLIDHTSLIHVITQYQPKYRVEVQSARAASQIGVDITNMGQILLSTAQVFLPKLKGPLLNNSNTPLLTPPDMTLLGSTIDKILPYVNDIEQQSHLMSLDSLPLSVHEREQIAQLLPLLPQMKAALVQGHSLLDAAGWLLGVNSPRTFLVQTMDRAEIRATGGFTGQYGELSIAGARVEPFSLRDISLVEYADNSPTSDKVPPTAYRSWWPFANWGLRDSNLSADFPTSAQLAIAQYKKEVNRQVDGVILFTPFLVEQVLQVTGPVYIPLYNETITAQNLESRLHYYQLDNAGIKKQQQLQGNNTSTSQRKAFTSLVAHTLMDTVRHASLTTLLALGKQMLHAMQTKDLQVYMTNPQIEGLLVQHGDAAQMDRSTTHDGFYIVQMNVSASKASQYVRTTIHDTVTLDANGGATHVMQLGLEYNQLGPVYGYDTYRDYVRVYVPPTSKLLWGDGFDTGQPLCGGNYDTCPSQNVYKGSELVCPSGMYEPGAAAPSPIDPNGADFLPLDKLGGPTNTQSDEAGRAMFAGYVVIPKNCTMRVTLSWYVPPMNSGPYNLLVQRQAATFPDLNLTILPSPNTCTQLKTQELYVDRVLAEDTSFTLPKTSGQRCYTQPAL